METNIIYKKIKLDRSSLGLSRKYGIDVVDIALVVLDNEDRVNGPFHYGLELEYNAVGQTEMHKIYFPVNHPVRIRDGFDALFLVRWARNAIYDGMLEE